MAEIVYISLGSNIGNKLMNLKTAVRMLGKECIVRNISSVYESAPVDFKEQDTFLNQVVEVQTDFNPAQLLAFAQSIEKKMGREKTVRWGPRVIDLDILLYGSRVVQIPDLTIPHERMHKRRFVLVPLSEISPQVVHPVIKKTAKKLLSLLPKTKSDWVKRFEQQ